MPEAPGAPSSFAPRHPRARWIWMGAAVLAALLLGIGVRYYTSRGPALPDYLIPGVPAITLFSEDAINSPLRSGSAATIVSVLRYWGETPDLQDANDAFFPYNRRVSYGDFIRYAEKFGYTGTVERLPTPRDLKKYLNAQARTPLIVQTSYDTRNPSVVSASVVIGVSERSKTITLHNWTHGNNYEVSFDEFDRLWTSFIPEANRYYYLIIQPKDLEAGLAKLPAAPAPYPVRLKAMDSLAMLFSDAAVSVLAEDPATKEYYLKRVMGHPAFNTDLVPWLRVLYRATLAETQIKMGKLDEAKQNIELADAMNHDLDRPFGEWPAYTVLARNKGQIHDVVRVWGAYYAATGDQAKAAEYFKKNDEMDLFRHDRPH